MRWHDERINHEVATLHPDLVHDVVLIDLLRRIRDDYEGALIAQRAETAALLQSDRFPISRGELESLRFRLNEANELLEPLVQENDSLKAQIIELQAKLERIQRSREFRTDLLLDNMNKSSARIAELEAQLAATLTTIEAAASDGALYAEGCAP